MVTKCKVHKKFVGRPGPFGSKSYVPSSRFLYILQRKLVSQTNFHSFRVCRTYSRTKGETIINNYNNYSLAFLLQVKKQLLQVFLLKHINDWLRALRCNDNCSIGNRNFHFCVYLILTADQNVRVCKIVPFDICFISVTWRSS